MKQKPEKVIRSYRSQDKIGNPQPSPYQGKVQRVSSPKYRRDSNAGPTARIKAKGMMYSILAGNCQKISFKNPMKSRIRVAILYEYYMRTSK